MSRQVEIAPPPLVDNVAVFVSFDVETMQSATPQTVQRRRRRKSEAAAIPSGGDVPIDV